MPVGLHRVLLRGSSLNSTRTSPVCSQPRILKMRFHVVLLALFAAGSAQDFSRLPPCAYLCLMESLNTLPEADREACAV